jgi:hypothetical protein
MVENKEVLAFLFLMFVVCFVFPLTVNYIAQGYDLPSEARFFTVMIMTFMVVFFTIWLWVKSRS